MTHIGKIEKGIHADLDELAVLYDQLNDSLETGTNYPGWIKGIYPVRETAAQGVSEGSLYVLRINGIIAGSIILNHEPEKAYEQVEWGITTDYVNVLVVRTLVVHPHFMRMGVASILMDFARKLGIEQNMKAIRLDVSIDNAPAITLYEKLGYQYVGTVDLGLGYPHLIWFRLYEMILE